MITADQVHLFDLEIEPALREFLSQNSVGLETTVDWVCDVFDQSADVWLIDRIIAVYDQFNDL